jgi:hypothetical protein
MKSQAGFGFMMLIIAGIVVTLAVIYFYQAAIIPQVQNTQDELLITANGDIGLVRSAISACETWRSPQAFFDPGALSMGMVKAINAIFPEMRCGQDHPLACEQVCACLIKLNRYCQIGFDEGSVDNCLGEPCRVVVEG